MDGLGYGGAYERIAVPDSLNPFAAIATLTFTGGRNSFLWPLVTGRDPSARTVRVALSSSMTDRAVDPHLIFTATAISIPPGVRVPVPPAPAGPGRRADRDQGLS